MRYRKLSPTGDYSFGRGLQNFYINVPQAPAQAVLTRLVLYYSEWFVDTSDGTKWLQNILGVNTGGTRDLEVTSRVLGTPNVTSITTYSSSIDPFARTFSAVASINTTYGPAQTQITGGGGQLPTGSVSAT